MGEFTGPLFIVGAPWSGTGLVRNALRHHPALALSPRSTLFLPWLARRWPSMGDLSDPAAFRRFHRSVRRFRFFAGRRLDRPILHPEKWHAACRTFTLAGVFEAALRLDMGLAWDDRVIWGDRSPEYMLDLPLLKQTFRRARFIHVIRDGRDVALTDHEIWKKSPIRTAHRWARDVGACRRAGKALGRDYHEIRFEHLLDDPERELAGLSDFLEIPYQGATRELEHLAAANGSSPAERWQRDLSYWTARRIERVAGPLLWQLSYPLPVRMPPAEPPSRSRLAMLEVLDGASVFTRRMRRFGLVRAVSHSVRQLRLRPRRGGA